MIQQANGSVAPDSSRTKRTEATFRVTWNVAGEPAWEEAGGWVVRHVHSQVTENLWEHLGIFWSKNEGEKKVKPWSMSGLLKRWEVTVLSGRGEIIVLLKATSKGQSCHGRTVSKTWRKPKEEVAYEGLHLYLHMLDQTICSPVVRSCVRHMSHCPHTSIRLCGASEAHSHPLCGFSYWDANTSWAWLELIFGLAFEMCSWHILARSAHWLVHSTLKIKLNADFSRHFRGYVCHISVLKYQGIKFELKKEQKTDWNVSQAAKHSNKSGLFKLYVANTQIYSYTVVFAHKIISSSLG